MGSLGAILLAAGASTRMGSAKQLLPWKDSTLLEHAIQQLKQSDIQILVVVLGANAEEIRRKIDLQNIYVVVNPDWKNGMSTSIATGLGHLLEIAPDTESVLIALSDQPLLDSKYFKSLIDKYSHDQNKIVSSSYSGRLGVPAIFAKDYFSHLLGLKGHKGARALLRGGAFKVATVNAGERAVDLDTKESYDLYYELHGRP